MPEIAIRIGGFIRWLFKRCQTDLSDEVNSRFEPRLLRSYELENYLIGIATILILFIALGLIFFS